MKLKDLWAKTFLTSTSLVFLGVFVVFFFGIFVVMGVMGFNMYAHLTGGNVPQ